jgi:hypothetical protein
VGEVALRVPADVDASEREANERGLAADDDHDALARQRDGDDRVPELVHEDDKRLPEEAHEQQYESDGSHHAFARLRL